MDVPRHRRRRSSGSGGSRCFIAFPTTAPAPPPLHRPAPRRGKDAQAAGSLVALAVLLLAAFLGGLSAGYSMVAGHGIGSDGLSAGAPLRAPLSGLRARAASTERDREPPMHAASEERYVHAAEGVAHFPRPGQPAAQSPTQPASQPALLPITPPAAPPAALQAEVHVASEKQALSKPPAPLPQPPQNAVQTQPHSPTTLLLRSALRKRRGH